MVGLRIEDRRTFTRELFVGEMFDPFLVREAVFVTFNTFSIDGCIRKGYYTEREMEEGKIGEYSSWPALKPFCYDLMKGKRLPERFHIVFQLTPAQTEAFIKKNSLSMSAEQVRGLYVNIRYEDGNIDCVTGVSVDYFTLDKSLEKAWDEEFISFLRRKGIPFSQG